MAMKPITLLALCALSLAGQQPSVDLFAESRILKIDIQLPAEDWKYIRTSHRKGDEGLAAWAEDVYEYRKGDVTVNGVKIGSVGIRKKGFLGSAISTRPSLKLNLDKYVKGQQFEGLEMLTLNNNNQDASMVQTLMVYDYFRRAGVPVPRAGFAHVTVNGENLGVYTNVESMDKILMQRLFGSSNGILYEGYGGDLNEAELPRIVEKSGARDQNRDRLKELVRLLAAPDPVSLEKIQQYVEFDSFMKLWVAEVLIGHWDSYSGNRNNFYLYQNPKTQKLHFLPWGPDSAFTDPGPFLSKPIPKSFKAVGLLCRRLWELPEIRTRYRAEMTRQLASVWKENELIARVAKLQRDVEGTTTANKENASAASDMIAEFIKTRREDIQKELSVPAPDWPATGVRTVMGVGPQMTISGTFDAPFPQAMPASLFGTGSAAFQVSGAKTEPVFQRFSAAAQSLSSGVREGYVAVSVQGMAQSDKVWVLGFAIDPFLLGEKTKSLPVDHFEVWARVVEGANSRITGVTGEMKFKEVSLKPGGRIVGSFTVTTAAF
jgi:hypothetical protein